MCGFKFFDRKVAQELINTGIDTKGWFFSTEMLVKAEWKNIKIKEIPVKWTDDRKSKVKILSLLSVSFETQNFIGKRSVMLIL